MVNITNDGWFRNSTELDEHLAVCTFRAVENRVPIARCANTGISALIAPDGRIAAADRPARRPIPRSGRHADRQPGHDETEELLHRAWRPVRVGLHGGAGRADSCGVFRRTKNRRFGFSTERFPNERNRLRERRILRSGGCEDFDPRPRPAFRRRPVRGAARQQRAPLPRRRSLRADVGRPERARHSGSLLREPVRDDPDRAGAAERRAVGMVYIQVTRGAAMRAHLPPKEIAPNVFAFIQTAKCRPGRANIRTAWPW